MNFVRPVFLVHLYKNYVFNNVTNSLVQPPIYAIFTTFHAGGSGLASVLGFPFLPSVLNK